jgi:hypothetical protein
VFSVLIFSQFPHDSNSDFHCRYKTFEFCHILKHPHSHLRITVLSINADSNSVRADRGEYEYSLLEGEGVLHGAYRLREGTATFTLSVAEDVGSTFL